MRQFIDVTGKTEDEAIQNALRQLGLDRDDVSVEILERAKSGFLGLGSCPAKVRVSYGPEEEEEVLAPAPAPKEKPQEGEVIAVGPGRVDDNGNRIPVDVKVGDVVIYSRYGGTEVKYEGQEFQILSSRDVLAVVER